MKRVSFKVAKAIKEAGYPQECGLWYNKNGVEFSYTEDYSECYARPTYIEVWLWLWREKKIHFCPYHNGIEIDYTEGEYWQKYMEVHGLEEVNDPEEAIIMVIEYLVNNNLIK